MLATFANDCKKARQKDEETGTEKKTAATIALNNTQANRRKWKQFQEATIKTNETT